MKRFLNFRPLVVLCLSLLIGILIATINNLKVCIVVLSCIFLTFSICLIFYLIKKLKVNTLLFVLIISACLLTGFAGGLSRTNDFVKVEKYIENQEQFSAEIESVSLKEDYILIKAKRLEFNGEEFNCKVYIRYRGTLHSAESFNSGDRIVVSKNINYSFKNVYVSGDVVGSCTIYDSDIVEIEVSKNIFNKIRNYATKLILENSGNYSSVVVATLFGEKAFISQDIALSFSNAGLGHLLAVSGLHVGFLLSLLNLLFKRLFKNKLNIVAIIESIVLFIYMAICGFSPSICRASIMAIISLIAMVRGKQYDGLNALSISAIVLMIVNPLVVFATSFIISYLVVFTIFMINGKINYWLNKIMPAKISSSLSICISAWLGSLPLTIYYFDSLSIISILLNLIFVPLFSLVFMIAFTFVIVSILLPFLASIIKLPAVLFGFLVKLLGYISNATRMFNISVEIVGVIMFYCAIILAGDYIFIKEKRKCILSGLFMTGFIFSCIVSSLFV